MQASEISNADISHSDISHSDNLLQDDSFSIRAENDLNSNHEDNLIIKDNPNKENGNLIIPNDNSIKENEIKDLSNKSIKANNSNKNYSNDKLSNSSNKNKTATKISAKNVNTYYKEKSNLIVYLRDSNNKAIKNKSVRIVLNGKSYSKITDSLGKISLNLNLKPNKYKVKIIKLFGTNTEI